MNQVTHGATFIYSYGHGRHEVKKVDRKTAAEVIREARRFNRACSAQRTGRGSFTLRHVGLVLKILVM